MEQTPFELALSWARKGHRVLPVSWTGRKRPLIKQWQIDCTTDPGTIARWWAKWPEARVGLATGEPGYDVLDFDVAEGKPGLEQLERLIDLGVLEPGTFIVVGTPSGGRHLYFKGTQQHNKQNEKAIPGVDFRGVGGMVLAPGNDGYRIIAGASLEKDQLKTVDWLAVAAALAPVEPPPTAPVAPPPTQQAPARPAPPPAAPVSPVGRPASKLVAPLSPFENPVGEESPLDWYVRTTDLGQVLIDDGWSFAGTQDGRDYYTRPGKRVADGVSANIMINPDGRQTLFNFSSSIPWLPTDRAINAGMYLAYRDHGGDIRLAASHIRRTMMPRHSPSTPTASLAAGVPTPAPAAAGPTTGTPGAELVPVSQAGVPQPVRDFWRARPELQEIWFQATETGFSPWAILGYVLAMVDVRVGPHVVLPPRARNFGGTASLNLFVAIVGDTGDGKDEASKMAKSLVGAPNVAPSKPGTGQGIAALFTEQTKEGPVQINDTAYLHESEVSGLGSHADLQGSTLVSTLLSVYMAQQLGEHYANKEKRRPVPEGRYRLALTVGVQPSNSHILLDEKQAASGLPQRFIWMPATWPDAIPDGNLSIPAPSAYPPKWRAWSAILPGSLDDTLDATGWSPNDAAGGLQSPKKKKGDEAVPLKEPVVITYAPELWSELDRQRKARDRARKAAKLAGERTAGAADSHLTLTRLKVAALLSIWLDGSLTVRWEAWELAGQVMWVSNVTRLESQNELARKAQDQAGKRAAARAQADAAVKTNADAERDARVIRVVDRLRHLLATKPGPDGWTTVGMLHKAMSSKEKRTMADFGIETADVLNDMVLAGILETREAQGHEQGERWKLK